MRFIIAFIVAAACQLAVVNAECPNACSAHGKCGAYDMCLCFRNWMSNDCSERICQFGLAHVDTPKGDLDMDGVIESANNVIVDNSFTYPFGTTEQFPQMQDSDLQELQNSAHYYMECSNKGKCDRTTGECQCYDGYDGVACQRASCPGYPNSCSGHGTCKTIEQLAHADNGNVYKLWDRKTTMGCDCDAGYGGPDCSQRQCKSGVDPLYLDDVSTVKASIYEFATLTTAIVPPNTAHTAVFTNGEAQIQNGAWSIRYFDNFGEDWVTEPIPGGADCDAVTDALYGLPNNVIPPASLICTKSAVFNGSESTWSTSGHAIWDAGTKHPSRIIYKMGFTEAQLPNGEGELSSAVPLTVFAGSNDTVSLAHRSLISGFVYRVKFLGNPGKIRSPEIEIYLDGKRPSLVSRPTSKAAPATSKVITKVWTDGQQGEDVDYFADHCDGVTATITRNNGGIAFLNGMTIPERNLLKKCLGASDFDTTNNVEVYNWDKGSKAYPHIVKLVRTVTTQYDGGYYAVLWFDPSVNWDQNGANGDGTFKLLNPFTPPDTLATDNYDIYTTKGTLALTSDKAEATFGFASKYIYMTNITYDRDVYSTHAPAFDGDISCEVGNNNAGKLAFLNHCLNKTDLFTLINWERPALNPPYINLYTAERLHTSHFKASVADRFAMVDANLPLNPKRQEELHYMTHFINTDIATNWAASVGNYAPLSSTHNNFGTDVLGVPQFKVYKFFPAVASSYEYVAQCSNRGICDTETGTCQCFPGYTDDNCAIQSSLAV
eukprot:GDKK01047237.1.p1 GENE.GDKK01047237.1~~GDKK01047237.1.p1  ORF type:complete len:774 (+),score=145.66 GDKK01047237.1:55-2376(+)